MILRIQFILLYCITLFLIQCTTPTETEVYPPRNLTRLEKQLVESDNKFGFKLFQKIVEDGGDSNIFISPLSVSMALGMTLNGANGETQKAMEQTLELAGMTTEEINGSYKSLIELLTHLDQDVIFDIANSIWYRQEWTFEESFINLNRTYFNAVVRGLDFNSADAAKTINNWVEENTNGKIGKIMNYIDPYAVMFLINAIYFKGTWTYQFDKDLTADDWFTRPGGSQVPCKMMLHEAEFHYLSDDLFQAIDLPYGDGLFSMTILLPHPESNIDSLIARIDQENWDTWMNNFSTLPLTLYLPTFTLEYEIRLNSVLSALGMDIAFDPNSADFTRTYQPGGLYISEVKHKTYVKVDEEGTEAAAVTSVGISTTSEGITMRMDHPFVFAIRERDSGTILFMGKIVEPSLD